MLWILDENMSFYSQYVIFIQHKHGEVEQKEKPSEIEELQRLSKDYQILSPIKWIQVEK